MSAPATTPLPFDQVPLTLEDIQQQLTGWERQQH